MTSVDATYYRVSPKFWSDPRTRQWNDDTRLLAFYLLTCPHRTTEGLFRLPLLYAQADLQWLPERLTEPLQQLVDDGFIEWDPDAEVVLIVKALSWQSCSNPNQATAAVRRLAMVPETPLKSRFRELAERFDERLAERLPEGFGEGLPSSISISNSISISTSSASPDGDRDDEDPTPDDTRHLTPVEDEFDDDVIDLTREVAKMIAENGHPLPSKGSKAARRWVSEMDLLRRRGVKGQSTLPPPTDDEILAVARWATQDEFWRPNIQSVPKFREKYAQLALKARASPRVSAATAADNYAAAAAQLRAQGR